MTFQTRMALAFSLIVVIVCAMGVVSYRNLHGVEETRIWGRHSTQVLHRIESFHAALERCEQIAFVSAGDGDRR